MASEVKLELIDGQIVAFAGGTVAHGAVCNQIVSRLSSSAVPGCTVFTSSVGLQCAGAATYVFPDACYTCEVIEPDAEAIVGPRLIVEVISPESVERDRVDKLDSYQAIPSVEEYLIVDSRRGWACIYRRSRRDWRYEIYSIKDTIELCSIDGVFLKMTEIYAGTPIVT